MPAEPIIQPVSPPWLRIRADHVLLVDDDPDLVAPFRMALRRIDPELVLDWETTEEGAVSAMEQRTYSAVISDYLLEEGDGIGVCRAAIELLAADSLAMISGHPIRAELDKLGGAPLGFLPKPFSQERLTRFLRRLLVH